MRFEAKHKYFKNLTHVIKNFKNVPKSLAARHQARMCYQLSGSNSSKNQNIGTVKYVTNLCIIIIITTGKCYFLEIMHMLMN